MLTITRSLTWNVNHSITDDGTTLSDLRGYSVRSQIREKYTLDQEYPFVIDVTVTMTGEKDSYMKLSLSKAETESMVLGDYLIDVIATKDGVDEFLLNKEAVKVVGFVTLPEDPDDVPDFVAIFNTALTD